MAAYLIDEADDINPRWLERVETVLVTAGASAPESVVEQCLQYLRERYQARVETRLIRDEQVHFPLPRELRRIEL